MKKILLGLITALALISYVAPAFAEDAPAGDAKAEKKGRTKAEVDEIIRWLTGYTQKQLESILGKRTNIETFIFQSQDESLAHASVPGQRSVD